MAGTLLLGDLCLQGPFIQNFFCCREKDALISASIGFVIDHVAFFKNSKSNLNANVFYHALKKSWGLRGSNVSPVETQIYEVHALSLAVPG